ncbi:MAG: AAA family ATPase [Parvibaculales bacterium]
MPRRNNELVQLALEISKDIPVFPCARNKKPVCKGGFYDATQDADKIKQLFANKDAALIGMPTGTASGISVIDIDVTNGKQGENWKLENAEKLGVTCIASTPSGGYHYYYQHLDGLRNTQGIDGCVDIRGEGGYVIHAASPGYGWLKKDEALAPFPKHFSTTNQIIEHPKGNPPTLSLEQMTKLRDDFNGNNWNKIVSKICYSAFEQGWSNHQFREFIAPICNLGVTDPDLDPIVDSVRRTRGTFDSGEKTPPPFPGKKHLPLTPIGIIQSEKLKPRELIHGLDYIAGTISLTVAAGGVGKSMVVIQEACAIANNGNKVMLLMLEDDLNEVKRRVKACLTHHGYDEAKIAENLIVLSEETRLTIARVEHNHPVAVDGHLIREAAMQFGARVIIADPFVQTHEMNENDNGQMNFVADQFRSIAKEQNIAVMLVHHTRKGSEYGTRGENARGASALKDAARSVRELRQLGETEASELNIDASFAHEIICLDHTKANYTKRAELRYLRKIPVLLSEASQKSQISATVEAYIPETYEDLVTDEHRNEIRQMIIKARKDEKPYVKNPRNGSRNIYKEAQAKMGLPLVAIKRMVSEMYEGGVLEKRKYGRSEAALAVVGIE